MSAKRFVQILLLVTPVLITPVLTILYQSAGDCTQKADSHGAFGSIRMTDKI